MWDPSFWLSGLGSPVMVTSWPNVIKHLVGGFKHDFYFPFHIWDVILPIDKLIFFKMVKTTNQTWLTMSPSPSQHLCWLQTIPNCSCLWGLPTEAIFLWPGLSVIMIGKIIYMFNVANIIKSLSIAIFLLFQNGNSLLDTPVHCKGMTVWVKNIARMFVNFFTQQKELFPAFRWCLNTFFFWFCKCIEWFQIFKKALWTKYIYILYIYYHILLFNTLFTVNDEHVLTFFPAVTVDRLLNCWPTSLAVTESKGESTNIYS